MPKQPFDARRVTQASACGLSLVRFDTNRYSVPVMPGAPDNDWVAPNSSSKAPAT